MKKRIYFLLLTAYSALSLTLETKAQNVSLTITNPCPNQRQEVIEADLETIYQKLGSNINDSLIVKNALGQEITYQKSYNGKLLLSVSLQPDSKVTYTILKGKPSSFKSFVYGRVYPERLDDLTWENDRSIYRIYGPALQQTGERSFGTDVWVKNTPELVAEERYRLHNWGWHQGDSLRKAGMVKEGNKIIRNTSFHLDHGYGMDVYSVGPSLGCGAPALMKNGSLIFPYCFKDCKILDNGPLRFSAEVSYHTNCEGITEHRIICLDYGSHYNKTIVWYDGMKQPTAWASGVVLNGSGELKLGKDYVLYADPTDNPKVHQSQIYVGTLFPNGVDKTTTLEGQKNHGVGIINHYNGQPYTYYFGSAWSNYDVKTFREWQLLATEYLNNVRQPLIIQIQ